MAVNSFQSAVWNHATTSTFSVELGERGRSRSRPRSSAARAAGARSRRAPRASAPPWSSRTSAEVREEPDPVAGANVSVRMSESLPFGIVTSVRSSVRMRVERIPIRLDGPEHVLHLHEVADAERLIDPDGDRAEQVLDGLLRGERERDAADAEAGEEARHLEPELVQHRDAAEREQHHLRDFRPSGRSPARLAFARVHGAVDMTANATFTERRPHPEHGEVGRRRAGRGAGRARVPRARTSHGCSAVTTAIAQSAASGALMRARSTSSHVVRVREARWPRTRRVSQPSAAPRAIARRTSGGARATATRAVPAAPRRAAAPGGAPRRRRAASRSTAARAAWAARSARGALGGAALHGWRRGPGRAGRAAAPRGRRRALAPRARNGSDGRRHGTGEDTARPAPRRKIGPRREGADGSHRHGGIRRGDRDRARLPRRHARGGAGDRGRARRRRVRVRDRGRDDSRRRPRSARARPAAPQGSG